MIDMHIYPTRLVAEPGRVVIRPFQIAPEPRDLHPTETSRMRRIVDGVLAMDRKQCELAFNRVDEDFADRHHFTRQAYLRRYEEVATLLGLKEQDCEHRTMLIGAYFCHEYSFQAAAIMNPSVVPHPDQDGLKEGALRLIISLRTVGEGHISTISFREATIDVNNQLELAHYPGRSMAVEAEKIEQDGKVVAHRNEAIALSGAVIFPFTAAQRNGLEDVRLTPFTDPNGTTSYLGTYTAYSGSAIRSEMLSTTDFVRFTLDRLHGSAAVNKGMALFPRKIDGQYAMLGRQDGENLYLLRSNDLLTWDGGERILAPEYPWELVQLGNCGSPIELDEGWLVLTHGVGAMRKYSIGAILLDKNDCTKVIGRLRHPLVSPSTEHREGYVPNVVYTCGAVRHGDKLFMPYGVADSSVSFALIDIASMLSAME